MMRIVIFQMCNLNESCQIGKPSKADGLCTQNLQMKYIAFAAIWSPDHRRTINSWIEALIWLKNFTGIDKYLRKQIEDEKLRWTANLERMISIVFFLASNNLSFTDSSASETLYTPDNGNCLCLVRLLRKHVILMMEHLRRVLYKETNVHYFGKCIQNELIGLFQIIFCLWLSQLNSSLT